MYWPTGVAKRLHLTPGLGLPAAAHTAGGADEGSDGAAPPAPEPLLALAASPSRRRFATLTRSTLSVWSTRPPRQLAALRRTPRSTEQYGDNVALAWRADGHAVCVLTSTSYLLLFLIAPLPSPHSYVPASGSGSRAPSGEAYAPSLPSLRASFAAAAGEHGAELRGGVEGHEEGLEIVFRLVLRVDAGVGSVSSSATHLLLGTVSPPAMQCIPWPPDDPEEAPPDGPAGQPRTSILARLDWIVRPPPPPPAAADEQPVAAEVPHVVAQCSAHTQDAYFWLTSDGRAYQSNVTFDTRASIWRGRCFHGAPRRRRASQASRLSGGVGDSPLKSDDAAFDAHNRGLTEATDMDELDAEPAIPGRLPDESRGTALGINPVFSLAAVGLASGRVAVYTYGAGRSRPSHVFDLRAALRSTASYLRTGEVRAVAWSDDGYALAVAWERGWSVWSTYGKLMCSSLAEGWDLASPGFSDTFMHGAAAAFWVPGNTELFLLHVPSDEDAGVSTDQQLFAVPFAKSAVAGQHSPDNTRYAFVQLDDAVLVYRGSDQPDMSVINPESDVWHHIQIPQPYIAANWPIRYACISADGRLIAVAGRRGLAHFSSLSGRWKCFAARSEEQSFAVRGGLQWYQHVLIAACSSGGRPELRLYSRDAELDERSVLHREELPSPVVLTSLFDNSLLVYTQDNTLYHFLIDTTPDAIRLNLCGSITFEGVVAEPERVRGMSWMIPPTHQQLGDPMDDLTVATVIFLTDGKLVLLRPRRAGEDLEEVAYDMQILGDHIEYFWTHLSGIGTLENSLWGYDGQGIKLWLDALTIEHAERLEEEDDEDSPEYKTIEESVSMPLDFYPLCVLIEKGIVIGVDPEISLRRTLDFAIFRSSTNTHLFLQHVLRCYLEREQLTEAVLFASHYQSLVYFAHTLEILLHAVLEDEADALLDTGDESMADASGGELRSSASTNTLQLHSDSLGLTPSASQGSASLQQLADGSFASNGDVTTNDAAKPMLPLVVEFLDHFDDALDVVVGCARKTEVVRWSYLFDAVGEPRELFERCIASGHLKTAGSYLLVLHNLEPLEESTAQAVRLLKLAAEEENWALCRDLLRFTRSIDEDGSALRHALRETGLLHDGEPAHTPALGRSPRASVTNLAPPVPSPTLLRSTSAPTVLDFTLVEEEEPLSPEIPQAALGPHPGLQRAVSLFGTPASGPPVPQVSVNGRVMPSAAPPRRISTGSPGSGRAFTRSPSAGLGMSLSRVGLRSTERVWKSNTAARPRGMHTTPLPPAPPE